MKKINIAVIGCGNIANAAHIPAYTANPNVEILYFCDIIPARAEAAVTQYGRGTAITDYKVALADPRVDAVSVCTYNITHPTISMDALRAGKDVLCEKPAARTYQEALEMQKVQHETGKLLNIGVVNRFSKSVNMIKDMIDADELGNVYHVYVSFRANRSIPGLGGGFTTKDIAGGGVLIDWGVHFLDIVMYCLSDPAPLTVSGQAYSLLGKDMPSYTYEGMWAGPPKLDGTYDVEECITGLVRTEKATLSINGAWAQNIGPSEMFIDFLGDKAGVRLDYNTKTFTVYTAQHGALVEYSPKFNQNPYYETEINDFVDCVLTGRRNAAHIDNAVITAKMMQALYDSSDMKKEISL